MDEVSALCLSKPCLSKPCLSKPCLSKPRLPAPPLVSPKLRVRLPDPLLFPVGPFPLVLQTA